MYLCVDQTIKFRIRIRTTVVFITISWLGYLHPHRTSLVFKTNELSVRNLTTFDSLMCSYAHRSSP